MSSRCEWTVKEEELHERHEIGLCNTCTGRFSCAKKLRRLRLTALCSGIGACPALAKSLTWHVPACIKGPSLLSQSGTRQALSRPALHCKHKCS